MLCGNNVMLTLDALNVAMLLHGLAIVSSRNAPSSVNC